MGNYLEAIPCDILQHIALLTTTDSNPSLAVPRDILALLLTSSTIHHALCMKNCPHLYADIFRTQFDVRAALRRFKFQVTDSALAGELVLRWKMLRRVRRRSFLTGELRQDLWTAFWMIQESDGLNELYLHYAGLPEFLLDVVKSWDKTGEDPPQEFRTLIIWLLCFTLTQQHILSLPVDVRVSLQSILSPYSRSVHEAGPVDNGTFLLSHFPRDDRMCEASDAETGSAQFTPREYVTKPQRQYKHGTGPIVSYGRNWVPSCPDLTPAAISLVFCLKEIDPIVVPEHLPESRSIAIATQRFGPTKEDVRKIRGYRTRLFADTAPWNRSSACSPAEDANRSERHDIEFQKMILVDEGATEVEAPSAMYGMMTGVWEGFYMMAEVVAPTTGTVGHERPHAPLPDFICRQPLQCALTEFVCFDGSNPNLPTLADVSGVRSLPQLCFETEGGFEVDGRKYERLMVESDSRRQCQPDEEARKPVEIILLGETLEEHEQAWGGFRFAGSVRTDGSIILKRESKEVEGDGGWTFEGRMRFGTVFVGTWYLSSSSVSNVSGIQGIFSMQKRVNGSTSW